MVPNQLGNVFVNIGLAMFSLLALLTVFIVFSTQTTIRPGVGPLKWTPTVVVGGEFSVTRVLDPEPPGCDVLVTRSFARLDNLNEGIILPEVRRGTISGGSRMIRTFSTKVPEMEPGEYVYVATEQQYCKIFYFWTRLTTIEYETFLVKVVDFSH
jgi:hypothetical protein